MNQPKIYKRAGYEFQVVESSGIVSRAVGRKGKRELHDVVMATSADNSCRFTFDTEQQAIEKYGRILQASGGEIAG
jgi:hypothetical protein